MAYGSPNFVDAGENGNFFSVVRAARAIGGPLGDESAPMRENVFNKVCDCAKVLVG
jgi:hypothetical protein